ncbi:DMT family transporter [Chitinophaga nivalis]|uniref:DMT family transporter n=1 Tax=Chitinophaga nivalis TaxID=2991709 RepID=A0ABT3IKB1_9BACT|nr:DMT family transporter [Chitinophaga nivalis]MCW3465918.1 DMT family transporter [Chitinophaga nivalis]MCW3484391.1 DMT family transporter [Chitinophaga nivalis]
MGRIDGGVERCNVQKKCSICLFEKHIAEQILIGGLGLLPLALLTQTQEIHIDTSFIFSLCWLVFMISIVTMALWFYLLKKDIVKASQWLYLTPVAGYVMGYLVLGEPITRYSLAGTLLVLAGLRISHIRWREKKV